MVRIAVATVAVSVAVMIIATAVIAGFRTEISERITAFTGHLRVTALDYGGGSESEPLPLSEAMNAGIAAVPGVRSVAPYALKMGIVKTADATQGLMLKGVDAGYDLTFFEGCLVEGSLPRLSDSVRHKDLLISAGVGRMLRLGVDDRVEMLFVEGDRPRRDRFRVCGLYSSGLGEMDDRFAITDMASVQRLAYSGSVAGENAGMAGSGYVTGYEIVLDGMERLGEAQLAVEAAIAPYDRGTPPMMVRTVVGEFPQLFDWLSTHDVNAAVIIAIMIVVALVAMTSALLIIVLERIRMIGVLKTMGMTDRSLRRIFVMRAATIVATGVVAGNVLGIGVAVAQQMGGFMTLDAEGYFLSRVPMVLDWWRIVALDVGTAVVIVAAMVLPTTIVGRIEPEKTVRFQ